MLKDEEEMQQLTGLTELCEFLSISTEDTLATFPTEQVVPLLVGAAACLPARPLACLPCLPAAVVGEWCCCCWWVLVGAARRLSWRLAWSCEGPQNHPPPPLQVNFLGYEHNPDLMLLAARALTFLADVFPPAAASIIRHGAVPAFCARLLTIEYIDLAEQSLQVRSCLPLVTGRQQRGAGSCGLVQCTCTCSTHAVVARMAGVGPRCMSHC